MQILPLGGAQVDTPVGSLACLRYYKTTVWRSKFVIHCSRRVKEAGLQSQWAGLSVYKGHTAVLPFTDAFTLCDWVLLCTVLNK